MKRSILISIIVIFFIIAAGIAAWLLLNKGTDHEILTQWDKSNETNAASIDHSAWDDFLLEYIITDDESGVYMVDYENGLSEGHEDLSGYIASLEQIDPRDYNRNEQMAYWINLYNALTVKLILDNYPVQSITKLGQNKLTFGPWDDPATTIAGESLHLNNIEHGILRPLWQDDRIHFAVNCASFGCPNLQPEAFTADNLEDLLDEAAQQYLAHPRGARFEGNELVLSSIFKWYAQDFGNTTEEVLQKLSNYAPAETAEQLKNYKGEVRYEYDWGLNGL